MKDHYQNERDYNHAKQSIESDYKSGRASREETHKALNTLQNAFKTNSNNKAIAEARARQGINVKWDRG